MQKQCAINIKHISCLSWHWYEVTIDEQIVGNVEMRVVFRDSLYFSRTRTHTQLLLL